MSACYVSKDICGTIYLSGLCRVMEAFADLTWRFQSRRGKPQRITRHSLMSATDCSGTQGVGRQVCSGPVFRSAGMSSQVPSPSSQVLLRDKSVWSPHVVSEPQCDHRTIHARLQKVHGHRVPQAVNSDPLLLQRGASFGSRQAMLGQQVLHAVDAETFTLGAGKEHVSVTALRFANQAFSTASVDLARGVQRSLRPLPIKRR